eukprot:356534-Chlamydomonas_euryale.AAC.3
MAATTQRQQQQQQQQRLLRRQRLHRRQRAPHRRRDRGGSERACSSSSVHFRTGHPQPLRRSVPGVRRSWKESQPHSQQWTANASACGCTGAAPSTRCAPRSSDTATHPDPGATRPPRRRPVTGVGRGLPRQPQRGACSGRSRAFQAGQPPLCQRPTECNPTQCSRPRRAFLPPARACFRFARDVTATIAAGMVAAVSTIEQMATVLGDFPCCSTTACSHLHGKMHAMRPP